MSGSQLQLFFETMAQMTWFSFSLFMALCGLAVLVGLVRIVWYFIEKH